MRIGLRGPAFALCGLLLGGALFVWSGLFDIAASRGHWAVTGWLLHTAMRQSVQTYAIGIEVPALDDPALVHRGAGHFAAGCAPCHGSPAREPSPVALEMTPPPPNLEERLDTWEPQELFWIVRHGIKYTGMPAWPALQREDEVWAVVAFLRRLPELDQAAYLELALGPVAHEWDAAEPAAVAGDAALANCARCHGRDGAGRGIAAFPLLSGQSEVYLRATLAAYAAGRRHSGFMQTAVAGLSRATLDELAAHFAAAEPDTVDKGARDLDAALVRRGRAIATEGLPGTGVPACTSCHGSGDGDARYPAYPRLAGQNEDYLATQLRLFGRGERGGTPFAHIMTTIAGRLEDDEIAALAAYFASLPARELRRAGEGPAGRRDSPSDLSQR